MPTTVLPSVTRCHYLDNLKVLLTVLVVFHHAGQAYGVYFFHLFVIIGLQYAFDGFDMGSGTVKFLFIGICATVVSFALVYLVRSIPGMKRVL